MKVVIYARFSSHAQNEQSIEGQLKACHEFAQRNNYRIVGEYIDRALSGTNDNRPEFQRMMADSNQKQFEGILVYQLDRFTRNRYDSAIYKSKLKKNGVRVFSARENISDDASGILLEGIIESLGEYYSVELSQKIKRGQALNAEKLLVTGGYPPFGFKTVDKKYVIDEDKAPFVKIIFDMYANGHTVKEIIDYLNSMSLKTATGVPFNKNSIRKILMNKRYTGVYMFNGSEVKNGLPRIIDDSLFEKVNQIIQKNKKAPARSRAKDEYLLTTKMYCGVCGEMMIGVSGTSKTGKTHKYYICKNARKRQCEKDVVKKDFIEDLVVHEARRILSKKNIASIAKEVVRMSKVSQESSILAGLERRHSDNQKSIKNLMSAIEMGNITDIITKRIYEINVEQAELEKQIVEERKGRVVLTLHDVEFFLNQLKLGRMNDIKYRKALINTFVSTIYAYDDKIVIVFNTGDRTTKLTEEVQNSVEILMSEYTSSTMNSSAPPIW